MTCMDPGVGVFVLFFPLFISFFFLHGIKSEIPIDRECGLGATCRES
jgi:hypothetical protein